MDETVRSIRTALVDAIAAEHRFRRQSLHEGRESERWQQRADVADVRELPDLGAQARARADHHQRAAALYERRAAELSVQVERLRDALAATQGHGRAPPATANSSLEGRFTALELESELERMRRALRPPPAPDQLQAIEPSGQQEGG